MTTYTGTIPCVPVPYFRMTSRTKWSKPAQRYHASQARVGAILRQQLRPVRKIRGAWKLAITIFVRPTKDGAFPGNRGDVDNVGKAVADALQHARLVEGDDMRYMRAISAEVELTDGAERVEWTLEVVE